VIIINDAASFGVDENGDMVVDNYYERMLYNLNS
jgi:hypothetical protein